MIGDLFNPTEEHRALRELVAEFTRNEVEPQAARHPPMSRLSLPTAVSVGSS